MQKVARAFSMFRNVFENHPSQIFRELLPFESIYGVEISHINYNFNVEISSKLNLLWISTYHDPTMFHHSKNIEKEIEEDQVWSTTHSVSPCLACSCFLPSRRSLRCAKGLYETAKTAGLDIVYLDTVAVLQHLGAEVVDGVALVVAVVAGAVPAGVARGSGRPQHRSLHLHGGVPAKKSKNKPSFIHGTRSIGRRASETVAFGRSKGLLEMEIPASLSSTKWNYVELGWTTHQKVGNFRREKGKF